MGKYVTASLETLELQAPHSPLSLYHENTLTLYSLVSYCRVTAPWCFVGCTGTPRTPSFTTTRFVFALHF